MSLAAKACSLNGTSILNIGRHDAGLAPCPGPASPPLPDKPPSIPVALNQKPSLFPSRRQERRLRSQEAVERQRATRAAVRVAREARRAGEAEPVAAFELAIVSKMIRRREARRLHVHPIQNSYLYWSLKRIGHDVLLEEYRVTWPRGFRVVLEPSECPSFRWWRALMPQTRAALTQMARKSVDAQTITPEQEDGLTGDLRNPAMVPADPDEREKVLDRGGYESGLDWGRK